MILLQNQHTLTRIILWIIFLTGIICVKSAIINKEPCKAGYFRCKTGRCIPSRWQCDQETDCSDGSDEDPTMCMDHRFRMAQFPSGVFNCVNGTNRIPIAWKCDGYFDCRDKSDELNCENKTCSAEEFTCKNTIGECIPLAWMCDQNNDCSDGSDEMQCNETCRADEFTCSNGKCIQKRWRCDMDDDCGDMSDEQNCPPTTCAETDFKCADNTCIKLKWQCDGDPDCPDGSDERGCTTSVLRSVCVSSEYQCKDRTTCIHRSWLCDGGRDCPDGDDEMAPNCVNITCRADQFQCKDLTCISGHYMCSGKAECADGSDENDCPLPLRKCDQKTEFDCGGGMCIPNSKVCDKKVDCPDAQDEPVGKCGKNECLIRNGDCEHLCVDTPVSYFCECKKGYALVNNRSCVDIDECKNPGACSQSCTNEIGTFKCECNTGYMRDPRDHTRCKAIEGHASLLFARRHDIRKIALDHNEMTSIVNDTKSATALDYVFRTGMIFWSDVSEQKIYKAPIDEGNDRTVVVRDQLITSDGLAVDWIYSHIYYSDTKKCTIEVTNFDGNMGKALIKDDLEIPRAIALDPIDGYMYWTDWGSSPRIERAGMDGSHRQTIVSSNVKWPNGLTIDLEQKKIYWVDAKLFVISACNYDGSDRRVILYSADTLRHPFSITTFEDFVYWTDWDKAGVFKANKFTGENVTAVTPPRMNQHPMTIHIYHPYRQPDGVNHCQAVNGHCSHLCLPAPQINHNSPKISCACPTGLKLMKDGLMCVEDVKTSRKNSTNTRYQPSYEENSTSSSSSSSTNKTLIDRFDKNPKFIDSNKTSTSGQNLVPTSIRPSGNNSSTDGGTLLHPEEVDSGIIAGIFIAVAITVVIILGFIAFCVYRHYVHRNLTSMNFDNPVYRKTTEDQIILEKNLPARMYPSTVDEERFLLSILNARAHQQHLPHQNRQPQQHQQLLLLQLPQQQPQQQSSQPSLSILQQQHSQQHHQQQQQQPLPRPPSLTATPLEPTHQQTPNCLLI